MKYGYLRVSTKEQNPMRQMVAMNEQGIPEENIYLDYMSGKDFSRPEYLKLMRKVRHGDLIVIKSIDRLGRNYEEIKEQWKKITKDKGVDIKVLDMPLLDTTVRQGDLTGVFISDIMLQLLAYVAETERSFIKQRQSEGIAVAKANGVRFGRSRVSLSPEFEKSCNAWLTGQISLRQGARITGMSISTFYRRCKEYKAESGKE